jgi:hypothetical protein
LIFPHLMSERGKALRSTKCFSNGFLSTAALSSSSVFCSALALPLKNVCTGPFHMTACHRSEVTIRLTDRALDLADSLPYQIEISGCWKTLL